MALTRALARSPPRQSLRARAARLCNGLLMCTACDMTCTVCVMHRTAENADRQRRNEGERANEEGREGRGQKRSFAALNLSLSINAEIVSRYWSRYEGTTSALARQSCAVVYKFYWTTREILTT